jgi:hypothetical protein
LFAPASQFLAIHAETDFVQNFRVYLAANLLMFEKVVLVNVVIIVDGPVSLPPHV